MPRNNSGNRRSASFNRPQQRPHSTAAAVSRPTATSAPVPATQSAPKQAQSGGIMSNILQTAAGVAIGHTVGRMLTGVFGGSGSSEVMESSSPNIGVASNAPVQCQADAKRFLDCMSQNYDDVAACQQYLEMMRQCQSQFAL